MLSISRSNTHTHKGSMKSKIKPLLFHCLWNVCRLHRFGRTGGVRKERDPGAEAELGNGNWFIPLNRDRTCGPLHRPKKTSANKNPLLSCSSAYFPSLSFSKVKVMVLSAQFSAGPIYLLFLLNDILGERGRTWLTFPWTGPQIVHPEVILSRDVGKSLGLSPKTLVRVPIKNNPPEKGGVLPKS